MLGSRHGSFSCTCPNEAFGCHGHLDYLVLVASYELYSYYVTCSSSVDKRASSPSADSKSLSSWIEEDSGSGLLMVGDIIDLYPECFGGVSQMLPTDNFLINFLLTNKRIRL